MIIFNEDTHNYVHLETGNKLNGWTSFIKKYTKEFDEESQLTCSAYKMLLGDEKYNALVKKKFGRLYNLSQEEVANFLSSEVSEDISHFRDEISYEWEYSRILGTKFHKEMEMKSYDNGYEICPFTDDRYETIFIEKQYDNQTLADDLYDLEDGYYPELLVWDKTMGQDKSIVTQIDSCFIQTLDGIRYVSVNDIKTNSKRPVEYKGSYMLAPLDSIYDNTVSKYKLQVMFGAKLMSTFGYTPKYCAFTHYLNYDINNSKIYPAKYDSVIMQNLQDEWTKV